MRHARNVHDARTLRREKKIENPRGYLIRIATNLWIDAQRRRAVEACALATAEAPQCQMSAGGKPQAKDSVVTGPASSAATLS